MADSFIFIDSDTSFSGTITAEEVIVEGVIKGDITASEKVLVKNGAVINGDIVTNQLLYEEGGQHNGMIRLGQPQAEDLTSEKQDAVSLSESDPDNHKSGKSKSPAKKSGEEESSQRLW